MKKIIVVIAVIVSPYLCFAATYKRVNLAPEVLKGDVDVSFIGRDIYPEGGGIIEAVDVDLHQITTNNSVPCVIEFVPTNKGIQGITGLVDVFYGVSVVLPAGTYKRGYVEVASYDDTLTYRITLTIGQGIKVYKNNQLIASQACSIAPYTTYEVNISDITGSGIQISVKDVLRNGSLFTIGNLDGMPYQRIGKFYVGSYYKGAVFRNEKVTIFE